MLSKINVRVINILKTNPFGDISNTNYEAVHTIQPYNLYLHNLYTLFTLSNNMRLITSI